MRLVFNIKKTNCIRKSWYEKTFTEQTKCNHRYTSVFYWYQNKTWYEKKHDMKKKQKSEKTTSCPNFRKFYRILLGIFLIDASLRDLSIGEVWWWSEKSKIIAWKKSDFVIRKKNMIRKKTWFSLNANYFGPSWCVPPQSLISRACLTKSR